MNVNHLLERFVKMFHFLFTVPARLCLKLMNPYHTCTETFGQEKYLLYNTMASAMSIIDYYMLPEQFFLRTNQDNCLTFVLHGCCNANTIECTSLSHQCNIIIYYMSIEICSSIWLCVIIVRN